MMQRVSDLVMTYLDPVGVVVGLAIAVPVIWTWWEVTFGQCRRRRRLFRASRENPGSRPGILLPARHAHLRRTAARVLDDGVDVVHFFNAGPAVAAAMVGAELVNACRVNLYQYEQTGYAKFGPLKIP